MDGLRLVALALHAVIMSLPQFAKQDTFKKEKKD
jgi:hypothetical protein